MCMHHNPFPRRSQWPRGLRRGSAVARLLALRVRIPPGASMSVCCECCVLSGRGLCDGLIPRPEESYRVWCDCVWSWKPQQWGGLGPNGAVEPQKNKTHSLPVLQYETHRACLSKPGNCLKRPLMFKREGKILCWPCRWEPMALE